MNSTMSVRQKLTKVIDELPAEVLPELANFVEYLRFKVNAPEPGAEPATSGSAFLLGLADLGASDEADLSERDEEILANEIDPIRGWGLKQDNRL